ncbi:MAG: hypothetical protein AAGI14_00910 [Pseudomonadota bacterium]
MRTFLRWTITALSAGVIAATAAADTLLTFKIESVEETRQPAFICAGDERDPARFGGLMTDDKGMVAILIPAKSDANDFVHNVIVTAYDRTGSTRETVDLAARHASDTFLRERRRKENPNALMTLKLDPERRFDCGKVKPISSEDVAEQYQTVMMALKDDVMAELEEQGSEATEEVVLKLINQNVEFIARYENSGVILPAGHRAAIQEVLEEMAAEQRRRERSEKLKQFIKDFVAAARALADEREAAREQARLDQERKEAEEKAAAEEEEERKAKLEVCFGALGPGCGIWGGQLGITLCGPSPNQSIANGKYLLSCTVNSGSWGHDECCADDENGHWCFGPGTPTNRCRTDFDRGVARLISPFSWERHDVDPFRTNDTGLVEHDLYCAKPGTPVWDIETGYCCGKTGREFNGLEAAGFAFANGAWVFAIPRARICQ